VLAFAVLASGRHCWPAQLLTASSCVGSANHRFLSVGAQSAYVECQRAARDFVANIRTLTAAYRRHGTFSLDCH
jgi:hypothetical protein